MFVSKITPAICYFKYSFSDQTQAKIQEDALFASQESQQNQSMIDSAIQSTDSLLQQIQEYQLRISTIDSANEPLNHKLIQNLKNNLLIRIKLLIPNINRFRQYGVDPSTYIDQFITNKIILVLQSDVKSKRKQLKSLARKSYFEGRHHQLVAELALEEARSDLKSIQSLLPKTTFKDIFTNIRNRLNQF